MTRRRRSRLAGSVLRLAVAVAAVPVRAALRLRWRILIPAAATTGAVIVGAQRAPVVTALTVCAALYLAAAVHMRARLHWDLSDREAAEISGPLVYLIRIGDTGLVKIGMTTRADWRDRVAEWATGRPERLHVETLIPCRDPARVEAALHAAFQGKRAGEKGSHATELFDLPAGRRWWRLRAEMVVARAR